MTKRRKPQHRAPRHDLTLPPPAAVGPQPTRIMVASSLFVAGIEPDPADPERRAILYLEFATPDPATGQVVNLPPIAVPIEHDEGRAVLDLFTAQIRRALALAGAPIDPEDAVDDPGVVDGEPTDIDETGDVVVCPTCDRRLYGERADVGYCTDHEPEETPDGDA